MAFLHVSYTRVTIIEKNTRWLVYPEQSVLSGGRLPKGSLSFYRGQRIWEKWMNGEILCLFKICKTLPFKRLQDPLQTWSVALTIGTCNVSRMGQRRRRPGSHEISKFTTKSVTYARSVLNFPFVCHSFRNLSSNRLTTLSWQLFQTLSLREL